MSLTFVYDSTIQPVKNETFTKERLESQILKSVNDLNKGKGGGGNAVDVLLNVLKSGKAMGDTPAESYRKDFRNDLDFYHKGYLWYLYAAYKHDLGIEVAPWYLWNVIMHQVAQIVKDGVDEYRHIFTKSPKQICIPIYDRDIDITVFTQAVKTMLPDPTTYDAFFPSWQPSDLPLFYKESLEGLFADMVQRFYSCMILCCCLPKVRVLGSANDWKILHDFVLNLKTIIPHPYLDQVSNYTRKLVTGWNDAETWRNFFSLGHCGSGHQECIEGDIRLLINKRLDGIFLSTELPSTLSRFPFKNTVIPQQQESAFLAGVIGGNIDADNYLVPVYDYAITYVDENRLCVNTTQAGEMGNFIQQLQSLNRLTSSSLKSHFTYHQPKAELGRNKILHSSERKKFNEGSEVWEKYLAKMYKFDQEYMKQMGDEETIPECTFEEFKARYQKRIDRGLPEAYTKYVEAKRITKLQTEGTYNVWFKHQIYMTNPHWFADSSDAILSYEMYQFQRGEAGIIYESISTIEGMKQFIADAEKYSKMTGNDIDVFEIVIATLDLDIWQLYFSLLDESQLLTSLNTIIYKYLRLFPDDTYSGIKNSRYWFTLDDKLVSHISEQFDLYFGKEIRSALMMERNARMERWKSYSDNLSEWRRELGEKIASYMNSCNKRYPGVFTGEQLRGGM